RNLCATVGAFLVICSAGAAAQARSEHPFLPLQGYWAGAGRMTLKQGASEGLACRGYYAVKDAGLRLGLAIRCASAGQNIHLRANLSYHAGRVSGTWEERSYNASGSVTGDAVGDRIKISIAGGGFSADMVVSTSATIQSVEIRMHGIDLEQINLTLS